MWGYGAGGHHRERRRAAGSPAVTTLRIRDGKREVKDGPFADTKERLGGYFVIEVADLMQPLTGRRAPRRRLAPWSKRVPCFHRCSRPVKDRRAGPFGCRAGRRTGGPQQFWAAGPDPGFPQPRHWCGRRCRVCGPGLNVACLTIPLPG
ncbi:MAG: YciI family protein [Tabrizicola sp.]|uniref:YciI family protein n=1 Tax=Tabrizicola sp. TaxID=2005166 RepID=UPI002ABB2C49|nr:YciI family protein [Tabrizicola sp.]MDZ4088809.1 YciI family protein [Tabrizicola sp.]